MDAVLRALVMYFFLMLVFKINGKRSIAQITMFDFIMLLIIGEATQQALIGDDFSIANSLIVITTLIVADISMSFLKGKSKKIEMILEGIPLILLEEGEVFKDRLEKSRVDEADILEAARELHGLQRLDQIRFAILERDGKISIIPKS
jgi:uncharacterized membrane protein YcaP (DUF421 family)